MTLPSFTYARGLGPNCLALLVVVVLLERFLLFQTTTTTLTTEEVAEELRARGVLAASSLAGKSPEFVMAWIAWWDGQPGAGPGVLVDGLRSGAQPPTPKHTASLLERERAYGEEIAAWLISKLPDVCRVDPRIVAWEKRLHGDEEARRMERSTSPHPAAVAAVIRVHHLGQKLTKREHAPVIRQAVRAFDDRAVADYEQIAAKREQDQEREAAR